MSAEIGDVFQITESHGRAGWIGAFVLVTEVRPWGIIGFVHCIETHEKMASAYIRLKWEEIHYVGRAVLVTQEAIDGGSTPSTPAK